ncbi:hypothetical protein L3X38_015885 [Prunus dulcis]|uniref:RING-type domain-containing protein n=1 Tax=Prunus dulcis TaxID=3755 RepID=A0AAD4W6Z4_PRUDU|nr:hypothetical protein L3X38_015885 [Prunus dulcis]
MGELSPFGRTLDDSNAVQLTGKIMMIAVLVLFLVVVFVPLPSSLRQMDTVATVRKGLDPLVLKSLPVLVFPSEDFKDGLECAVCLSELVQGEKPGCFRNAAMAFHVDCIDMWFQSHSTCPICRNPVAPESSVDSGAAGSSSALAESDSVQILSPAESLASGFSIEAPNFPTNVLFWGNQTQARWMLVIDIPSQTSLASPSPSPSPSGNRFAVDEDLKSPATTRLRSLKRLLSRDRRISPCSPSSVDVEQGGGRGQS